MVLLRKSDLSAVSSEFSGPLFFALNRFAPVTYREVIPTPERALTPGPWEHIARTPTLFRRLISTSR